MVAAWFLILQAMIPVIAILQDHLDVPSNTISSACSIESMCVSGSTEKVFLWKYKKIHTKEQHHIEYTNQTQGGKRSI